MPAVPGVDNGDLAELGGGEGRALLRVAHGDDIRVAAHRVDGVPHGLPLGRGAGGGLGEAQHAAPQGQHSGLKGEPGPGGGLEEEGGQLLMGAGVLVLGGVCEDVLRRGNQLVDFLHGEVGDVNDVSGHTGSFPWFSQSLQLSSEGFARNFFRRLMSSGRIFPSAAAMSHTASKLERL